MMMPVDTAGLRTKILTWFSAAFIVVALFLFLPAGTLQYWQAWVYLGVLFIPVIFVTNYFMRRDPGLLERRMKAREKHEPQKKIQAVGGIIFFLGFLVPGLDYRFGWSFVPVPLVLAADAVVVLGYLIVFLVFRENSYTSRIIDVEKGQRVVTTGPYAIIRHPMYLGVTLMFVATPVALGSWVAVPVFLLMPVFLIFRIRNEEEVLAQDLPGYADYCQRVKYRLIPWVW
jgi:protein-S-isoprenylcysteine O-methyltransferase Ste14